MSEPAHDFLQRINGDRQAVPEAGTRKPDPSEPWRYVCPDCGGYPNRECSQTAYRCSRCGSFWERDELHDKKRDGDTDG